MAERSYVDFDLQIEWVGTGYRARVLESPAGQAQSEFSLPFTDLEIENFMLRIGQRRRGRRRVETKDLDTAREFGSALFQSVFQSEVAAAYRSSLIVAERAESGLRVRLRLSGAPDLCDIPWEFLFDSTARRFVALSADSPIVRFLDVPGVTTPLKIAPPIKVLVVISSPADFEQLQVEDEWNRLGEALLPMTEVGALTLERLQPPTLAGLQRALRRDYHVLHFVGHGGFDEQTQDGLLVFEDEQGRGNEVSATYLSTLLHDADSLRLAVLNACDGARASRTDQFAGVAQSLLQQGVPAVVAMQFEISDEAALTFAREFYGAFAEGYPVEAALAEARKSMFALQNDSEWATPVLYLRTHGNAIFEITAPAHPAPTPPVELVPEPPIEALPAVEPRPEPPVELVPAPPPEPEPSDTPGELAGVGLALRQLADTQAGVTPAPEPQRSPAPSTEGSGVSGTGDGRKNGWGPGRWIAAVAGGAIAAFLVLAAIGALMQAYSNDDDDGDDNPPTLDGDLDEEDAHATAVALGPANFNGIWYTNESVLVLTQSGTEVGGAYQSYTDNPEVKTLEGTVDGRTVTGHFQNDPDNFFSFTISDDDETFDGFWTNETGAEHEWCGNRDVEELQDGCGYSGEWVVKHLPPSIEVTDDFFYITQIAGLARVEFESDRYGDIEFDAVFDSKTLAQAAGTMSLQASGNPTLRFEITFLVSDEAEWDSFRGTWRQTLPAGGLSGEWCAYRSEGHPPC